MTADHITALIADACALLDGPHREGGAFVAMATLRAELVEAAAIAEDPELVDDCCDVAAQLEERMVALEQTWEHLATPA